MTLISWVTTSRRLATTQPSASSRRPLCPLISAPDLGTVTPATPYPTVRQVTELVRTHRQKIRFPALVGGRFYRVGAPVFDMLRTSYHGVTKGVTITGGSQVSVFRRWAGSTVSRNSPFVSPSQPDVMAMS